MTSPLRPTIFLPLRTMLVCAGMLCASARGTAQDGALVATIRDAEDVVPAAALNWMDAELRARGASSVGGAVLREGSKLKVLVNPALHGAGEAPLTPTAFVRPGGPALPVGMAEALGSRARSLEPSVLSSRLSSVMTGFLGLRPFFGNSFEMPDSLEECIDRDGTDPRARPKHPYFVVLVVDVQVAGVESQADLLEVELTLRLFRVKVDDRREGAPVEHLELLWSDRGTGTAAMPRSAVPPSLARKPWAEWGDEAQRAFTTQAGDVFAAATLRALRNGPATNLLANPRLLEAPWVGARADAAGPALRLVTEGR